MTEPRSKRHPRLEEEHDHNDRSQPQETPKRPKPQPETNPNTPWKRLTKNAWAKTFGIPGILLTLYFAVDAILFTPTTQLTTALQTAVTPLTALIGAVFISLSIAIALATEKTPPTIAQSTLVVFTPAILALTLILVYIGHPVGPISRIIGGTAYGLVILVPFSLAVLIADILKSLTNLNNPTPPNLSNSTSILDSTTT